MKSLIRTGLAVALLTVWLAGCTTSAPPAEEPTPTNVDFASLSNSGTPAAVAIVPNQKIVITPPPGANLGATNWNSTISDPAVLEFLQANSSGPTGGLPMFNGLKPGNVTAVLTYTGGGVPEKITLNVTVSQ